MNTITTTGMAGLGFLSVILAFAVTIFWMVVAWRAMKAHERLARAVEKSTQSHSN